MKTLRMFTIILLAVLVISTWAPVPAYAQTAGSDFTAAELAKLSVVNHTGGTLFIRFSGTRGYSFSTSQQGRTTFGSTIASGKYRVTVWTSACKGNLTFKRTAKGGATVKLPAVECMPSQSIY